MLVHPQNQKKKFLKTKMWGAQEKTRLNEFTLQSLEVMRYVVIQAERQLIEEYAINTQTTISKVLRTLINQLKEYNNNELKQA